MSEQPAPTAGCEKCGAKFEPLIFLLFGKEVRCTRVCQSCVRRSEEEELALKNRIKKKELENAWRVFCPARYRDCDRSRLPFAREKCELIFNWRDTKSGRGFGLWGPPHIGKRRALFSLAKDLFFLGVRIAHVSAIEFERLLFDQYDRDRGDFARARLETLRNVSVLLLSDLGTEKLTENSQTEFYSLIEHRAQNLLPILWTSQFSGDQLAPKFSSARANVAKLAEARGHSAMERLVQISELIQLERESFGETATHARSA